MSTAAAEKATKLIALASSSNLEEARTAAYQACRVIRENKLVVSVALVKPPKITTSTTGYGIHDAGAPVVHLSSNGHNSVCGKSLTHAVNFYWLGRIPTLRNCCTVCVESALKAQKK